MQPELSAVMVVLMGARGSGKTTIARRLADMLTREWIDLDERVLERLNAPSVTKVWEEFGESAWRGAELDALRDVFDQYSDAILALGGGTPMLPEARVMLENARASNSAFLVYLRCHPGELARRLESEHDDRPALLGDDPVAEIWNVLETRKGTYVALSDLIVDTDASATDEVASEIHKALMTKM